MEHRFVCKEHGPLLVQDVQFENKGPHVGAYCSYCGKWLAWVSHRDLDKLMTEEDTQPQVQPVPVEERCTPGSVFTNDTKLLKNNLFQVLTFIASTHRLDLDTLKVKTDGLTVSCLMYYNDKGVQKGIRHTFLVDDILTMGATPVVTAFGEALKRETT